MKPNRRPCALLLLPLCAALGGTPSRADPVEDRVREIRSLYNGIEGSKLRSRKVEFEAGDEPLSGSCTTYYRGDEIVKIHLTYVAGDHGGSDEYFYYEGGVLFFAHAIDTYWRFTGETLPDGQSETVDQAIEHRVYLGGGSIVRHLVKEVTSKDPERLTALLAKAENRPAADTERGTRIVKHGQAAAGARNAEDLIRLLTQSD